MSVETALEIRGLTHFYGKYPALKNVNLTLEGEKIIGLLGRNGAGKTTLINIISASMFTLRGEVRIFGARPFERQSALRKLCYVREKSMMPPGARLSDMLAGYAGVYPNWDGEYAGRLAELFSLNTKKRFKQLSRGMESSFGLVVGLASRAELTIFDEPSLGLDAAAREYFYDELIKDQKSHPRTIVVSTHLIDEVTRIFDEVVIIDGGRVMSHTTIDELMDGYVMITGERALVESSAAGLRVMHVDELGDTLRFMCEWDGRDFPDGVKVEQVPLQRLFVYLTEKGGGAE